MDCLGTHGWQSVGLAGASGCRMETMKITDFGPFGCALMAALIPACLLVMFARGFQIDMVSVLSVVVPGMALAVLFVAFGMGWVFVLIGRLKRHPRWMAGAGVAGAVAMLELLGLVVLLSRAG